MLNEHSKKMAQTSIHMKPAVAESTDPISMPKVEAPIPADRVRMVIHYEYEDQKDSFTFLVHITRPISMVIT